MTDQPIDPSRVQFDRLVLENPNPVIVVTAGDELSYANPAGQSILDAWHIAIGDRLPAGIVHSIRAGIELNPEREIEVDTNGRRYAMHLVPAADSGSVSLYGRDVTDRRRAEQELAACAGELRTVLAALDEVIVTVDRDGRVVKVAPTRWELLPAPPEQFVGRTLHDLLPSDLADTLAVLNTHAIARGEPVNIEYVTPVAGRPTCFATTISPLGTGETIWVARDISERKRADDALRDKIGALRVMTEIEREIVAATSIPAVMELLIHRVSELMHVPKVIVILQAPNDPTHRIAHVGITPATAARLTSDRSWLSDLVKSTQSLDPWASSEIDLAHPHLQELGAGEGVNACACAPLGTSRGMTGAILALDVVPRTWRIDELEMLRLVASQASIALDQVRLLNEAKRRLSRLDALHAIDVTISSTYDLDLTLGVILDQVVALLGVDAASVLLLDPSSQTLRYFAGRGFRSRAIKGTIVRLGEGYAGRAALERHVVHVSNLARGNGNTGRGRLWDDEDLRGYYGVPLIAKGELKGILELFQRRPLDPDSEWMDFVATLARETAIAIDGFTLFQEIQRTNADLTLAYDSTLAGWARALDLRDQENQGHTERVVEQSIRLARAMGLSNAQLVSIRRGALLHDIGKLGIPDSILHKPEPYGDAEWAILRKHPEYAAELLTPIAYLRSALDIPLYHHEKWDGTGYPRGLQGEQIPLAARIFAVVDVWDAFSIDRPWQAAWPETRVRQHLRSIAGSHLDPGIVEVFLQSLSGPERKSGPGGSVTPGSADRDPYPIHS